MEQRCAKGNARGALIRISNSYTIQSAGMVSVSLISRAKCIRVIICLSLVHTHTYTHTYILQILLRFPNQDYHISERHRFRERRTCCSCRDMGIIRNEAINSLQKNHRTRRTGRPSFSTFSFQRCFSGALQSH